MARLPRLVVPNQPHHIIQRGNNRQVVFHDANDYNVFLNWLHEAAKVFKVAIHAYVLMPNHVHLLASPADMTGMSRMMQWVGRQYVPYFNRKHQRTGTLWEGRFRATVIDTERYLLTCSRYIELNPVRAGLVTAPGEYFWSSYAHHVGQRNDTLITNHSLYWRLGNTPFDRELAYRDLVDQALPAAEVAALTEATLKGWALGSNKFKEQLGKQTTRRVTPDRRGRPSKSTRSPETSD